MRKSHLLQLMLLIISTPGICPAQIETDIATEQEAREANEVADEFMRRMKQTRDVATLKDMFLEDHVRRNVRAERASLRDQSVLFLPSLEVYIKKDLISGISQHDWERLYAARFNLRYFLVLCLVSRFRPKDFKNHSDMHARKIFPARVVAILRANPFLAAEYAEHPPVRKPIETIEDFTSFITALEKATATLREGFFRHPPEETSIYKENLRNAPPEKPGLRWPFLYGTNESRLGFPKGTRYFRLVSKLDLFDLWMVKTDSGMKIVSAIVYPFS